MIWNESTIAAYLLGSCILVVVIRLFSKQVKFVLKVLLKSLIGGLSFLCINSVGSLLGVFVGINPLTLLACGLLGVPGFILVLVLCYLV